MHLSKFRSKIYKNLITWFCFTFLFGLFPIIFLFMVSWVTGEGFTIITVSKEMFFLNIILCADTLKTLHNESYAETLFSKAILGITIFILVISSVLYGITLIREEVNISIYKLSSVLYIVSVIVGFITQVRDSWIEAKENTDHNCTDFTGNNKEN